MSEYTFDEDVWAEYFNRAEKDDNSKTCVSTFENLLDNELFTVREMLICKNRKYGDSALNPLSIFAKGNASDLLKVRIDDKLSRIKNETVDNEDTLLDLLGYLLLLRIAQRQ